MCVSLFAQNKLDDAGKTEILDVHNKYRKIVGSPDLVWSNELEASALNWANSMVEKPQSRISNTVYGENVYWGEIGSETKDVVFFWASEVCYYHGEEITKKNKYKFERYTQIIWAETTEIGCAMVVNKADREIWVCHYNPKGNVIGEKPYKKK